jgi:anthranilate synthase/aminodeoxychorismate synthase-like glutamine amidotransferase
MRKKRVVLLIDNYDSFAHNLARYIRQLGFEVLVKRNDEISIEEIKKIAPDKIILSPGPKAPCDAGICLDVVREFASTVPIMGVCLGHQVIAAAFGAQVVRADKPMHGRASKIISQKHMIFNNLPSEFMVGRYHSLIVSKQELPDCLMVIAETEHGEVMAIAHKDNLVIGLQFHPESVLTEYGYEILQNFLQPDGCNSIF